MNKRHFRKALGLAAIVTILLCFTASYAQKPAKTFLERYNLSTTVINPDTAPTDGIYSWWTESAKKDWSYYGNEPKADEWLYLPEPLGFRGDNFQRFYIHFDKVYKVSPTVYQVEARSRCKDEYCHIKGQIIIDSVVTYNSNENSETNWYDDFLVNVTDYGTIHAHYEMKAYINAKTIARLFGHSSYSYLVHNDSIYYDAMEIVADGYENNQYSGKWVYLATNDTLTCNWGDFRIPESRDLDGGCGEFIPIEEYYDFGWKPYIDIERHAWIDDPAHEYYMFLYHIDEDWWNFTDMESPKKALHVPGHYVYAHSFHYDLHGNHLEVYETGTMDFQANGTAIDSARQVYVATLKDGGSATYVFNYVSPSRWRLNKKDFYFSGIKETFHMEVIKTSLKGCNSSQADELAKQIIKAVGGSIDYEYKFQLDTLTAHKLQWSFMYRDGHTDTWEFYRISAE